MQDVLDAKMLKMCAIKAYKLLPTVAPALDVEDLMQEARLAVWRSGVDLNEHGLVYTIAVRGMIDAVRRAVGRTHVPKTQAKLEAVVLSLDKEIANGVTIDPPSGEDTAEQAMDRLDVTALRRYLDSQPYREELLLFAKVQGVRFKHLAVLLGVGESRISQLVKKAQTRALEALSSEE